MNAPTVPHDDQWPAEFLSQSTQKVDRVSGLHVLPLHVEAAADAGSCRRQADRADHAQPIASIPRSLHRRFSPWRPGAAVHRLQHKPGFVEKNNAGAAPASFFLIRGQSTFRHCPSASGSCSRATVRGFCGLKPSSCKSSFRCAPRCTQHQTDHRSAAQHGRRSTGRSGKPAASGPAVTSSTTSSTCSMVSLRLPPAGGLAAKASSPPSRQARRSATASSFLLRRTACRSHETYYGASGR